MIEENVIQVNGGITIKVDVSVKNIYVEKITLGILLHAVAKMENTYQVFLTIQLLRVMKLLKKKQKQLQQIFMRKMQSLKQKNSIFYLHFLLITIALLIAVSIYFYLIKYKAKQKHLLPFYVTNNELKEVLY